MAIKAVNQIDVIDLTDGYSVVLTNDNYTFLYYYFCKRYTDNNYTGNGIMW